MYHTLQPALLDCTTYRSGASGSQDGGSVPLLQALEQCLGPLQGPVCPHTQKGQAPSPTSHCLRCGPGMRVMKT